MSYRLGRGVGNPETYRSGSPVIGIVNTSVGPSMSESPPPFLFLFSKIFSTIVTSYSSIVAFIVVFSPLLASKISLL
jgi:hypothetical protein